MSSHWSLKLQAVQEIDSRFSVWKCRDGCKRTTHWVHLKGVDDWVQVMCLSAGRETLGMPGNYLVVLSNESFICSASGSGLPSLSLGAHQREKVGKVCSLWDSLHPRLWNWKTNVRTQLAITIEGIIQFTTFRRLKKKLQWPWSWPLQSKILCVWEMACGLMRCVKGLNPKISL